MDRKYRLVLCEHTVGIGDTLKDDNGAIASAADVREGALTLCASSGLTYAISWAEVDQHWTLVSRKTSEPVTD